MPEGIHEIDRFGRAARDSKQGILCIKRTCIENETATVTVCSLEWEGVLSILRISLIEVKTKDPRDLPIVLAPKRTVVRQNITV